MTTESQSQAPSTKRAPLDDDAPEALLEELLKDPETRAGYESVREQGEFFAAARTLRRRLKLSQEKIAELMGTTQSAVSDLESGRVTPQLPTLERYAQALGARLELSLAGAVPSDTTRPHQEVVNRRVTATTLLNLWSEFRTMAAMVDATTWPADMLEPILANLQQQGWATSSQTNNQIEYSLNKTAGKIIGLYLRRDCITAVLQNLDAEVSDTRTATPADGTRQTLVAAAASLVEDLLTIPVDGELIGVGMTVAGPVNIDTGVLQFGPDLQNEQDPWKNVPLQRLLREELRARGHELPVALENDANASAVREYLRRLGKYIVAVVLSGGGVGVGTVRQSKGLAEIYHGAHFRAGEGGHTTIDPKRGPRCRAGFPHRGCLETVASAQGVLARLGIEANTDDEIQQGLGEANRRIRLDDRAAKKAFRQAGKYFGRFLAASQAFYDPDLIVVTAHRELLTASPCGELFRHGVAKALKQSALGFDGGATEIPEIEWEPIDRQTYAVAAGAAAWRYFLTHPDEGAAAPSVVWRSAASDSAAAGTGAQLAGSR